MVTVMHVPAGHSFPDATGVAFALGLGPPSLLAAIFIVHIPQSQSVFSLMSSVSLVLDQDHMCPALCL